MSREALLAPPTPSAYVASATAVVDLQGRFVRADPGFCALVGHPQEALLGRPMMALTHPDDRAENERLLRDLLAGRTPGFIIEKRYLAASGAPVWVRNSVTLVHDEAGRPLRIVAVVEDLRRAARDRSLLEGQTRVLEELAQGRSLAAVLDMLTRFIERHSDGMLASILVLEDGRRLRLGAAPSLPAAYSSAIDGVEIGPAVGSCGTAAYTNEPVYVEDTSTDPRWVDYRDLAREHSLAAGWSTPIRSSRGDVLGTFALYYREARRPTPEDIRLILLATHLAGVAIERARADERLQRLNTDLERLVEERTRQLALVNEELEAFSYRVAHDLRAPLRGVRALATDLLEDKAAALDSEAAAHLRAIASACDRMSDLIRDILRLSVATHGPVEATDLDLSALAREVADGIAAHDPGRAAQVRVEPGLRARADPRLLRIALENLLGNAWKFTAGVPGARIEVGAARENGDGLAFYVRDNGPGFDMAKAGRLFQAFQRLHSEYEGTGIGLATVRRIIEQHGGRIWARSAPGEGATFLFTLPDARA